MATENVRISPELPLLRDVIGRYSCAGLDKVELDSRGPRGNAADWAGIMAVELKGEL